MGFGEGEQRFGIGVIEPHHPLSVPRGRVDAGPLMEDGGEGGKGIERSEEFVTVEIIGE